MPIPSGVKRLHGAALEPRWIRHRHDGSTRLVAHCSVPLLGRDEHHAPRLRSCVVAGLRLSVAAGEISAEGSLHRERQRIDKPCLRLPIVCRRAVDGLAHVFDGGLLRVDGGPKIHADEERWMMPPHLPHLHGLRCGDQLERWAWQWDATDIQNRQQPIQSCGDGRMQRKSWSIPGIWVHRQLGRVPGRQRCQDADAVGIDHPRVFRSALITQAPSGSCRSVLLRQRCKYPVCLRSVGYVLNKDRLHPRMISQTR